MDAGGRTTEKEREKHHETDGRSGGDAAVQRAPVDTPPFTLGQLKRSIPPHCFQRSVIKSFSYVVQDLAIVSGLLCLALVGIPSLPACALRLVAWPLYWAAQGCALNALWIIGHECGHNAFSEYPLLDDAVGFALHSSLLVPYFSWKYSHRRHHSNIGSLDRDEAFVPKRRAALPRFAPCVYNNPAFRLAYLAVQLALGWPLYLAFNACGRPYPRLACHYDPYGPIYGDRERAQVFVSDAGVLATAFGLYKAAAAFGLRWVVRVYGVPLMVANAWLVLYTYLQHTHPGLPRYDASEWDWLRGSLATVDRDYGALNRVFHNVTNTHVVHHLFSIMPHYHAMEATKAIQPILGEYYRFDSTPVLKALWREARECIYVEAQPQRRTGVFWYTNEF